MHSSRSIGPCSRSLARRLLLLTASAAFLASSVCTTEPLGPTAARAAESGVVDMSGIRNGARVLRLGLQKSAVLKLPAAAKDVIVGSPDMVDVVLKNRNTAYLFARAVGQTNIFFVDANGRQILQLDLDVTLDTKPLKALFDRALPGNAIQIDSTGTSVVLKGSVLDSQQGKSAEDLAKRFLASYGGDAASITNLIKVAEGNQVMLKVKVVEFKRTVLKRLGIDLNGTITAGAFKFDFTNTTTAQNDAAVFDGTAIFPGPPVDLDVQLRALENSGLASVLAEPTLTAISGAPASFNAGGEYPYTNYDTDQTVVQLVTCTVDFRSYGITLNFTPTVLSEGRIALNIFTEVSDLAPNPYGTQPLIDTRNAQTSIELPSGGSMMLAGLIRNNSTQKLNNTPGVRSLPVVGALFSSQEFERKQSELVVIVTPYVVGPADEKKLATPIDRFNNATDLQQLFLGRLNKVYGVPGSEAASGYRGQVGHIIE